jgi:hypothetical protein
MAQTYSGRGWRSVPKREGKKKGKNASRWLRRNTKLVFSFFQPIMWFIYLHPDEIGEGKITLKDVKNDTKNARKGRN